MKHLFPEDKSLLFNLSKVKIPSHITSYAKIPLLLESMGSNGSTLTATGNGSNPLGSKKEQKALIENLSLFGSI